MKLILILLTFQPIGGLILMILKKIMKMIAISVIIGIVAITGFAAVNASARDPANASAFKRGSPPAINTPPTLSVAMTPSEFNQIALNAIFGVKNIRSEFVPAMVFKPPNLLSSNGYQVVYAIYLCSTSDQRLRASRPYT